VTEDEPSVWDRPIPAVILQLVGLTCLLVATAVLFDGWYVIGVLGLALVFGRTDDLNDALVLLRQIARQPNRRR
jgi:hypothetical protein